jgi:hypothetical protein
LVSVPPATVSSPVIRADAGRHRDQDVIGIDARLAGRGQPVQAHVVHHQPRRR